jgi:D-sedoheptulose 7-phosphate isomerase
MMLTRSFIAELHPLETLKLPDAIGDIIRESLSVKQAILNDSGLIQTVAVLGEEMSRALDAGRKVIFFGNGGSAAVAQHMAAELVGRFVRERRAIPALALTTNSSTLTAIGNDYSYERVFFRQLEAFGATGDVAIEISTSGKSANVIHGIRTAKKIGILTVGMTGRCGRELGDVADHCLQVPSESTPRSQEAHTLIGPYSVPNHRRIILGMAFVVGAGPRIVNSFAKLTGIAAKTSSHTKIIVAIVEHTALICR